MAEGVVIGPNLRDRLYLDFEEERLRQERKWGVQVHNPVEWISIIAEELGEATQQANELHFGTLTDRAEFRKELVHTAATIMACIEDFDSR